MIQQRFQQHAGPATKGKDLGKGRRVPEIQDIIGDLTFQFMGRANWDK